METLYFKVADLCLAVQAPDAGNIRGLLPTYRPFLVEEPDGGLALTVSIADGGADAAAAEGEEVGQFDSGNGRHGVYRLGDGYKIVTSTIAGNYAATLLTNGDFSRCRILLAGGAEAADRRFGAGNSMMIAFAFAAAYHGVLLMHSSVTMLDGKGYLFLGKSGTGKSTHSSLWLRHIPGTSLLNDDNPALRVAPDGSCTVYGTPWSGKTPCYRNLHAEAGAIVRLEQHGSNVITREPPLRAFASVLSSCSTMIWDKPSYDRITRTVEQVASRCPVYHLKCLPDEAAARLCFQTVAR